jgi:hypothetical protein
VAVIDLERRVAVLRADDDGAQAFPHALRGALAAMLAEPTWHVVLAFDDEVPERDAVNDVIDQARQWADERRCRLSVTTYAGLARATEA